jgi:phytoene dehydrogenase-like protein
VAPPGKQLLTAGAIIPFGTSNLEKWQEAVMNTLDRLIPGYRDKLLWVEKTTPADINQAVGERGAVIGAGQSTSQVGKNRLPLETPVQGLYLCGSEAGGSGVGMELAIKSAQDLAAKLVESKE